MLVRHAIATGIFGQIPLNRQIANLFRNGEQGAWFDPSDFSTLFQDSAGATPVTAVGQPVGLMLDKRLGLLVGENIATPSGWGNPSADTTKVTTAGVVTITNSAGFGSGVDLASTTSPFKTYKVAFTVAFTVAAAGVGIKVGSVSALSTATSGTYIAYVYATASNAPVVYALGTGVSAAVSNISIREIPGNHASQPTAINRPVLQQDASGRYLLAFNGTNSWMSTAAIDFTGTDKMTVCAGVKTSGVTAGTLLINSGATPSPGVDGIFSLDAPGFTNNAYVATISKTTGNGDAVSASFAVPIVDVLSAQYDGNAASPSGVVTLRRNGVMSSANSSLAVNSQYFLNAPIYIGCRGGDASFFNGSIYGILLRGATTSAAQISATEKFINQKTGAY